MKQRNGGVGKTGPSMVQWSAQYIREFQMPNENLYIGWAKFAE